jgi:eukaryotic-like serine/threonine-protein kinase
MRLFIDNQVIPKGILEKGRMAITPGTIIGRYHIVAELGQGGMATVYRAYDTRLRKDMAVKLIRQTAFSRETIDHMLARFEQEAVSLARLTHPNIIQIIDYDTYEGAPFLVMPFISGGTLKERLAQMALACKVMAAPEAARLLLPVARALDYAHRCSVLHRDVKPANILMTESGDPLLTDFGIARILDVGGHTLTGTGMTVGTPEFMAPEQWLGKPEPASDQYALGVILYELLTGSRPYYADTPAAVMLKHITEPLPSPRQYAAGLSEEAERVLYTALAKKAEDRYPTMAAFIEALEGLAMYRVRNEAKPTKAEPLKAPGANRSGSIKEPLHEHDTNQKGQNRRWWIRAGGLGGVVLLVVLIAWLGGMGSRDPIIGTRIKPIVAGPVDTDTSLLTSTLAPLPVIGADHIPSIFRELVGHTGNVLSVAFSQDSQILASSSLDNTIRVWRVSDGMLIDTLVGHTRSVRSVAFSPDDRTLASGSSDGTIRLWRVSDGSLIRKLEGHSATIWSVAYSPDGQILASASDDRTIRLWRVADGSLIDTLDKHTNWVRSLAFSPNGQTLASGSFRTISLWRVSDGILIRTLAHTSWIKSLAFSPDGQTLASAYKDQNIKLWRVADGSLVRNIYGHLDTVTSIAFSPDGQILASASDDGTVKMWWVTNGKLLDTLKGHTDGISCVIFSPDGRTLASGSVDKTIRIWNADPGE